MRIWLEEEKDNGKLKEEISYHLLSKFAFFFPSLNRVLINILKFSLKLNREPLFSNFILVLLHLRVDIQKINSEFEDSSHAIIQFSSSWSYITLVELIKHFFLRSNLKLIFVMDHLRIDRFLACCFFDVCSLWISRIWAEFAQISLESNLWLLLSWSLTWKSVLENWSIWLSIWSACDLQYIVRLWKTETLLSDQGGQWAFVSLEKTRKFSLFKVEIWSL